MKIRALTINIAGLQFNWSERRKLLIDQIRELDPDIVFLQETTVVSDYDQTIDLQKSLGLNSSVFTPYGNDREYEAPRLGGISILSRWPFVYVQNRKFPKGVEKYGARAGVLAAILVDDQEILLGTTHLSYRKDEVDLRAEQVGEFLKAIDGNQFHHVIIGGDFNATPNEPAIQLMEEKFLTAKAEGNTFKDKRIDYLFSTPDLTPLNPKIVEMASDHFGVMADYSVQIL